MIAKTTIAKIGAAAGAGLLALAMTAGSANAGAAAACDRACLEDLANQYLAAVVAHDAKRLPLTPNVKYTENTVRMPLNEGLWTTIDSIDPAKLWVTDAVTQQVVVYTGAMEWGEMTFLAVRLKAQGRRISEIETSVVRKFNGAQGDFTVKQLPGFADVWAQPITAGERTPRAVMTKAADLYFDGIEQSNGDIVPFENGECVRHENHIQFAGPRAAGALPGSTTAQNRPYETCAVQFSSGRYAYIPKITNRRCGINDEVRGIAFCIVHFQHPGNIKSWTDKRTGAKTEYTSNLAKYPNTTYIWEIFKVKNGKYRDIGAYVNIIPYLQAPGW